MLARNFQSNKTSLKFDKKFVFKDNIFCIAQEEQVFSLEYGWIEVFPVMSKQLPEVATVVEYLSLEIGSNCLRKTSLLLKTHQISVILDRRWKKLKRCSVIRGLTTPGQQNF